MFVLGELISFYLPALLGWVDSGLQGKGRLHKSPGKMSPYWIVYSVHGKDIFHKVKTHTTFVYQQTLQLHACSLLTDWLHFHVRRDLEFSTFWTFFQLWSNGTSTKTGSVSATTAVYWFLGSLRAPAVNCSTSFQSRANMIHVFTCWNNVKYQGNFFGLLEAVESSFWMAFNQRRLKFARDKIREAVLCIVTCRELKFQSC